MAAVMMSNSPIALRQENERDITMPLEKQRFQNINPKRKRCKARVRVPASKIGMTSDCIEKRRGTIALAHKALGPKKEGREKKSVNAKNEC
jgi:hypothetical protein